MASEAARLHSRRGTLDALERDSGFAFVSEAEPAEFETILPGWLDCSERPWREHSRRQPVHSRTGDAKHVAPFTLALRRLSQSRENLTALLRAYSGCRDIVPAHRPLHLIGDRGWESAETPELVERLASTQPDHYQGYGYEAGLESAYRSTLAPIQPSWHEGFGLPVVEAVSLGVPVICSGIPAPREVPQAAAKFFEPGSVDDLVRWLVELGAAPVKVSPVPHWNSSARCVLMGRFGGALRRALSSRPSVVQPDMQSVLHHVDVPSNHDPETPRVIVRGWCFAREGQPILAVEAVGEGLHVTAPVGLRRPDVAAAFDHLPGADESGFCFWLSNEGTNRQRVVLRARHRDGSHTDLRALQLLRPGTIGESPQTKS